MSDHEQLIALVKSFRTTLAYSAPEVMNLKCDRFISQVLQLADEWRDADAAAADDLPKVPGGAS